MRNTVVGCGERRQRAEDGGEGTVGGVNSRERDDMWVPEDEDYALLDDEVARMFVEDAKKAGVRWVDEHGVKHGGEGYPDEEAEDGADEEADVEEE